MEHLVLWDGQPKNEGTNQPSGQDQAEQHHAPTQKEVDTHSRTLS
jgi:hypothetical protein